MITQPILTVHNSYSEFQLLKVYMPDNREGELIYPIELDHDIFIMKWDYECKWHCNGIYDQALVDTIGCLIEEQELPEMFGDEGMSSKN